MESIPSKEEGPSPKLSPVRMFSLRIVHLDYYMAAPLPGMDESYSQFQGRGVLEVPVVRIFGSTTSGQKTCLHLHKAFPYFYVSYDDGLPQEVNEALAYVRRLASAVEKACKIAGTVSAKRQHVQSCSLVRGRKYYGYYPKEQLFIKIVLYYPQEISRMSTLLLSGGIMNHKFQLYESHIPYLLQILIDYNLYGMGHIHVSNLKFRTPLPQGSSTVSSLVKQVKSEFLYKTTGTAVEVQTLDSLDLSVPHTKEMDAPKNQVDSKSDVSLQQKKDELPSTSPVVKLVSPGSHQSTPDADSQPGLWLHGHVPGEWVWSIQASPQGRQGPWSKQTTCELEADMSVADILNRGELLFRPLQQTGPDVKMVQSLTPIWEEELLRTGEGGPAGSVDAQYQLTTRTVAPASSLEEAMRNSLFQIANAVEHQALPTQISDPAVGRGKITEKLGQTPDFGPMVHSTLPSDLNSTPLMKNNNTLDEQQGAASRLPAQGSLLQSTQLANGGVDLVSPELESHPTLRGNSPISWSPSGPLNCQQSSDEGKFPKTAAFVDDNNEIAVDEEAIQSHLSQRLQSQELDNEASELLRWLGATQDDENETHEETGAEVALSQMFSSPGMDSALLKALEEYENATEQECQAILDCISADREEEEEEQPYNDPHDSGSGLAHLRGDKGGKSGSSDSTRSMSEPQRTLAWKRKNVQQGHPGHIPQTDGPCDDEDSDGNPRDNMPRLSGEENREVSLREMMRRRRERRPHRKEHSSSPSSFSEEIMEGLQQGNPKERSACVSRLQELRRIGGNSELGTLDNDQVESRRNSGLLATTTGGKTEKYSGREKEKSNTSSDKKNYSKSLKFTTLPMVKAKSASSKLDASTQILDNMDTENCEESYGNLSNVGQAGSSNSLPYSTKSLTGHEVENSFAFNRNNVNADYEFSLMSSGDDRDCGGGDGPHTINLEEIGEGRAYDHSLGSLKNGTSAVTIPQDLDMHSSQMDKDEYSVQMQGTAVEDIFMTTSKGNELNTNENMAESKRNIVENSGSPDVMLADFSETSNFSTPDRNTPDPDCPILVEGAKHNSEVGLGQDFNEECRDTGVSVPSKLPIAKDNIGPAVGVDNEAVHHTQYLFTDMSDISEDSLDSGEQEWGREHNWGTSQAGIEDEGQEEMPSVHVQEQSQLAGWCSGKSQLLPLEASKGKESCSQKQNAVGTTSYEPFVYGLSAGKSDVARGMENMVCSTEQGPSGGPSLFTDKVGQTSSCGVLGLSGKISLEDCGLSYKQSSPVPVEVDDNEEQLYPLVFHQPPPDKGKILASYRELDSNSREEGGVYYGNVKDVSDRPTVMAGLIFDVKSRDAVHLRSFGFGGVSKRSKFEQGSNSRDYIQKEYWGAEDEMDSVVGILSHFENDGRPSYLITPAKPAPSPLAVRRWASSRKSVLGAENVTGAHVGGEQTFTMDANTGKLVPIIEIASAKNSQESLQGVDTSLEYADFDRPASPKYDEIHVLNLTHQPSALPSRKDAQRKPRAFNQSSNLCKEPSLVATTEKAFSEVQAERLLVPFIAQTTQGHLSSPENQSSSEELLKKAKESVIPGRGLPQDQQYEQPVRNTMPKLGRQWRDVSQMTAIAPPGRPTPLSQAGFRDPASIGGGQQATLMSIEVFAETRGDLLPDPRYDAIGCIVIVICEDGGKSCNLDHTIVLIRDREAHISGRCVDGIRGCETIYLPDEAGLLNCFARLVRLCDPDMLLGWEIQGYSLGLLAERSANLGIGLLKNLSRMPPVCTSSAEASEKDKLLEDVADLFDKLPLETKAGDEHIIEDEWGRTHGSGLHVGGRIVLNLWRIMRGEVKLGIYSLEAVAEAVLRRTVPRIPWRTLSRWFSLGPGGGRFRCLEYFIDRARLNFQIMDQLDLMNRTAELARVFGIDFYSVFSRGSQFRVESMMARLAHTQNYILVSPTRQQVADQPAMECLPLVMEPESRFYTSPVIVLDFQSLYPSMIIAYNLCFSTCLGKLVPDNPKVLGVTKLSLEPGLLDSLKECMTITPNGVMFVPSEVRPGVLPRLLQEILSTRIMVKKAMKQLSPDQKVLQRVSSKPPLALLRPKQVLNARQFALKLIANVTYGYTAAGFSGRMPCAEIADSIVQCGRLTLERAIQLVNAHPRWGGRVVYGDTDSMFVLLEGRTREEAHAIGQEIAAAVTEMNPPPVTLKMEKVYHPCVLLTKKRYVGYSYESPAQLKPTFDAKGIETIRRDSCPAVAKTLEHCLRTLFETQDLSQVKNYLQRQWGKILSGRVSLQDFIFAKEVRLGTYSARSPVLPPAAIVASKAMSVDPRAEPRYGERIPYVVVHGEPGARLVDMVVDPLTLIDQPSLRLHDTYYITKQIIPACQRIFMLVGVDLKTWFCEMPRVYRPPVSKRVSTLAVGTRSTKWDPEAGSKKARVGGGLKHGTIDQYYLSRHCTVCGELTRASQLLCSYCTENPGAAAILLPGRTSRLERELKHLLAVCRHCGGADESGEGSISCISLDCSVFFERRKVHRELQAAGAVALDLGYYPPCLHELF